MKLLTNFFSSAATKRPVITILVVLLLTGFFGYMAGQAEELSTSFGGELDTPEIQAQSKLGEYFQTSGSQSVFQIIMSGEDVLTVDGYLAWQEIQKAVSESEIYPYLVKDQGGAVQGIGWALNEEYYIEKDGTMANTSFLDYRMPTALDMPNIDVIMVEVANPLHPFGVRGVGEVPIVPPLGAVANAIKDATGIRIYNTPMNPRKILEVIDNA